MSLFLRPNNLHDPDRISSASTEAGVGPGTSDPTSTNKGNLRLRQSGTPSTALALDVKLQTGGNPYGPSLEGTNDGAGASIIWKNTTDGSTSYRGWIEPIYLVRVEAPVAYSATERRPSAPRTLGDGSLGFLLSSVDDVTFVKVTTAGVVSGPTTIGAGVGASGRICDFVVLPSGRLVALSITSGASTMTVKSWYSDDEGGTWAALGSPAFIIPSLSRASLSCALVDGVIVCTCSRPDAVGTVYVFASRDGGSTFQQVGVTSTTHQNVSITATKDGRILALVEDNEVFTVLPSGGFSSDSVILVDAAYPEAGNHAITTMDDGTIYVVGGGASVGPVTVGQLRMWASNDDGATFSHPEGSVDVFNLQSTPAASAIAWPRLGTWQGRLVMLCRSEGGSSDYNVFMMQWGGWESITDRKIDVATNGQPYAYSYIPSDLPTGLGWTATTTGGGATLSNQRQLNIIAAVGGNTRYNASATWWPDSAGAACARRIRFRVRINSGGDVTADRTMIEAAVSDGAGNIQPFKIRFSTTQYRILDGAGTTLATVTTGSALTGWHDFIVLYLWENTANVGYVSVAHKADAESTWTVGLDGGALPEVAGNAYFRFGGTVANSANTDWILIEYADDINDLAGTTDFSNPSLLAGRALPADLEAYVTGGLHLGAYSGAGVPGDTYSVLTRAEYGKRNVWEEYRPSRRLQSTADNTAWNVVFDAGANNMWHVRDILLFGTNARSITVEMNATDSWGAPSYSQALTTLHTAFPIGAGVRGPGYLGLTTSPNWRPHQFRSDGDGHRWFIDVGGTVYEIDDNDEQRIFVEDVDFSAAAGTAYIFSDRAGYTSPTTVQRYRFLRLSWSSQDTADGAYRLGTALFGLGFTPSMNHSHDFADVTEPNTILSVSDSGYRASSRVGPARRNVRIQWSPINAMHPTYGSVGRQVEDFFRAIEGSHTPVAWWRDTTDISTLGLYRLVGVLNRPNQRGELSTAIAAIDAIDLSEEF